MKFTKDLGPLEDLSHGASMHIDLLLDLSGDRRGCHECLQDYTHLLNYVREKSPRLQPVLGSTIS